MIHSSTWRKGRVCAISQRDCQRVALIAIRHTDLSDIRAQEANATEKKTVLERFGEFGEFLIMRRTTDSMWPKGWRSTARGSVFTQVLQLIIIIAFLSAITLYEKPAYRRYHCRHDPRTPPQFTSSICVGRKLRFTSSTRAIMGSALIHSLVSSQVCWTHLNRRPVGL